MANRMKAAVFVDRGRIVLEEKPIPEVGPNDALIRITTTTICGTDVHILKGEYPVAKGLTVGHEPVGVIEKLGSAVRGYVEGQRVIAGAICPSGQSNADLDGHGAQCGHHSPHGYQPMGGWRFGNTIDGAQAEYLLVPDAQANLAPVPDELTDEQVLMCPDILSTGFAGAERGKIRIGDAVAVFATGPIGLCAVAGARLMGATTIIAVDGLPDRLAAARRLGADHVVNFRDEDPVEAIARWTNGRGVDVSIEALGTPGTFESCLRVLRPGGTLLVADKHCVGGLPGNRTTPIVVAIVAAHGLTIPKTSSRAITSPAGTADVVDTFTRSSLSLAEMRRVVEREGGCLAWGGGMSLSPVDDVLIGIEHPLDIDSEGQLVASVLSKKVAAGSTHVLIDVPVGPTAKVRSPESAAVLARDLVEVGAAVGLQVRVLTTDGTQPVGRGIGPALEAHDVLGVLRGETSAPEDLRARALAVAGAVLELDPAVPRGLGAARAAQLLEDGSAWRKLVAIAHAQGGLKEPPSAPLREPVLASRTGTVAAIDNRRLARSAKLAGAPSSPAAGVLLRKRVGDLVQAGEPLFEVHAQVEGELAYALDYVRANPGIFSVVEAP